MTEITIPSEVATLIQQGPAFLGHAKRVVVSGDDYLLANTELANIKLTEKQLKEKYNYLLAPAKTGYEETRARLDETFKPGFEGLAAAKLIWDAAITGYRREQARIAAEESARRQEAVARQQQKLREDAAAEQARADKFAREQREKAEQADREGKAAVAARAREKAEARERESAANTANMEHAASTMTAAPVDMNVPKSDAGHGRKSYSGRLAEARELTKEENAFIAIPGRPELNGAAFEVLVVAIAQGITSGTGYPSIALLKLNDSALNKQATALKAHFRIPGCRLVEKETTVSAKGK